jgi:hypothetical protein
MRYICRLSLSLFLLGAATAACAQAPTIDPTAQIQWNLGTGSGSPGSNGINCTQNGSYATFPYGAQWGQTYTDTANNLQYTCSSGGWFTSGSGIDIGIHYVNGVNAWNNAYGNGTTITVAYADACINGGTIQIAQYYGGTEAIPSSCASLSIVGPVQPNPQVVDDRLTQTTYKGKLDMLSFGMDGSGTTNTTAAFQNAWTAANTISYGTQHAHTLYFPIGQYQINEANLASAGASLLEGESMQGSILNYDGAGGPGSYLYQNQGSNYGGARHIRMNGSNNGGTVTTMAQDFIHFGSNNVDAGVELEDLDFQGAFGNALTFGGGPNFFMRHFRLDAIGGYGWYVNPSTNGGNGDPYHISDGTLSNELPSPAVTNYGIGQGYIQGTGNVGSATYLSGGSLTGTGSVTLSDFNNSCSGATATMAVAGGVAGAITVTNSGSGCTADPTSAACASGTASCSGTVALTGTLTGGVAGAYTYGTVFAHNNTGFLWNLENIRDEEDIVHINIGNADEGTFWSDNDTTSSASGPTVTFHNYTVAGGLHPLVSTAAGGVPFTLIGANNFSEISALYKNRLTQQEYGTPFDGSAALYSFGRQAYSMQGIELEDQRFDVIPHANWTGDNVLREIGDWFFRHQTDFSPGTMGPFDVVVSPTSGRASMEAAESVTSVGTISSNSSYLPSYLASVTGISGVTVTGAVGSTVVLTGFNNGLTGAQALVTLATASSFSGASFTVLNRGDGATSAPTSATCSNGTLIGSIATCSGTATITSTITTPSASTYANLTASTSNFPAYIGSGVGSVKNGDNLLICSSGGSITQGTCTSATAVRVACVNMTASEQNCAGLSGKGVVVYPAPGCLPSSCAASGSVVADYVQATTSSFGLEANRVTTLPSAGSACPYEGDFEWLQNPVASSVMNVTCNSSLLWVNGPAYGASVSTIQTNGTNNTSQALLNFETSTANTVGLTVTPSNPSGGIEKEEISGVYSGSGSSLSSLPTTTSLYPTLNQNTTGTAATATSISTNGTGSQVWGMNSGGSAQGWQTLSGGGGTTTNPLTLNNSNSGASSGSTFNGSAAVTLSANTLGAGSLANANAWSALNTFSNSAGTGSGAFGTLFSGSPQASSLYNPLVYLSPAAATNPTFATNGTMLHINGPSGFTGDLLNATLNGGSSLFSVTYQGAATASGNITSGGTLQGTGLMATSANNNIASPSTNNATSETTAALQFAGSSTVYGRTMFYGNGNTTLSSGANYGSLIAGSPPLTTAATGTHAWLANAVVNPLGTVTSGGATVTNTADLYVGTASSGGTNNYSLYVAGAVQLATTLAIGTSGTIAGNPIATTVGAQAFGIATLSSGMVTVTNAAACTPSATCVYKLSNCGLNGSAAVGVPSVGTISVGTSFVINSYTALAALAADSSQICWQIN